MWVGTVKGKMRIEKSQSMNWTYFWVPFKIWGCWLFHVWGRLRFLFVDLCQCGGEVIMIYWCVSKYYLMAADFLDPRVLFESKYFSPGSVLLFLYLKFEELWTQILRVGGWMLILLFRTTFNIHFHLDLLNLLHIEALVFWIGLVFFLLKVFFKWFQSGLGWPIHF